MYKDNSDPKPFVRKTIRTTFMVKEQRSLQRTSQSSFSWFLNSYVSRHLCNNWCLFINTKTKSIDFIIIASQIIQTEEIGTVSILVADGITIELQNVALTLGYNLNLISLSQLQENSIIYYNAPSSMILIRGGRTIARAKKSHISFTFDLGMPGQITSAISRVMTITGRG